MASVPGSFIWYELMTTDVDAAADFYGAVVGWKIPRRAGESGGTDYRMIGRSDGGSAGGVLQLTPGMLAGGAKPLWLGYLQVRGVAAAVRDIEADGGKLLMPARVLPVGEIAMVADPLGSPFYVMDPVPPPDRPDATSDVFDASAAQHVRWNELRSPDVARAKAFYSRHFGFQFNESMPMGPMGDYCFFDHAGQRPGAVMPCPPGTEPIWLFYFGVTSVAAARRAIEAGGGAITAGPHQVPGGAWIIMATDPQGAPFGVVGPQGG